MMDSWPDVLGWVATLAFLAFLFWLILRDS
jgi:hypothetical protein